MARPVCAFVCLVVAALGGHAAARAQPGSVTLEELAQQSAEAPTIEIVTVGPGELLVESFGHAALCVRWPGMAHLDTCYNYGTTDFSRPLSLGWGFVRGDAAFWVERWPRERMLEHYRRKDRSIWVQALVDGNSTPRQRLEIARRLEHDARLENRDYVYHHFFDNCTTRVRDIVDRAFAGALAIDSDAVVGPTFREYGLMGFADRSWLVAATDFAIGRSSDRRATLWQAMFLPRILRQVVRDRLGVEAEAVYTRRGPSFARAGSSGRGYSLALAVLLALPLVASRVWRRGHRLARALSLVPLSTLGLALWAAALASPLPELRWNETLLVLVPTDAALLFLGPRRRQLYARVRVGSLAVIALAAAGGLLLQPLWMPILVALPTMLLVALPYGAGRGPTPRK